MKKLLIWVVIIAMMVSSMACSNGGSSGQGNGPSSEPTANVPATTDAPTATDAPSTGGTEDFAGFKVAAILPGVITDNGWSAGCYNACMELVEKYDVGFDYAEKVTASDAEEYLRGYAGMGYNLIIVHAMEFSDTVNLVAKEFPDSHFVITYGYDVSEADNVACVGAVGSGILSGIVAGSLTKTNKVAFLGGEQTAAFSPVVNEFDDGVHLVNPEAEVFTAYIGSSTDSDLAKELALSLINQHGIDVITASANAAGIGVIQAAKEKGIYALGYNSDQYQLAPETVVVSVLRNFSGMFDDILHQIAAGTLEGKLYAYGTSNNGTILSDWHGWDEKIPADKLALIHDTIGKLKNGEIDEMAIVKNNSAIS